MLWVFCYDKNSPNYGLCSEDFEPVKASGLPPWDVVFSSAERLTRVFFAQCNAVLFRHDKVQSISPPSFSRRFHLGHCKHRQRSRLLHHRPRRQCFGCQRCLQAPISRLYSQTCNNLRWESRAPPPWAVHRFVCFVGGEHRRTNRWHVMRA